ncbi:hypothetical protein FRC07_001998, partial [Ceratobasidium sp. 392]
MEKLSQNKYVKVSTPLADKSVLLVELNRAPVNAFNQPFWEELGATFDAISRDGSIRAVVLASSLDKIFTAGLDLLDTDALKNESGLDPARESLRLRDHILHFQCCISSIERCTQPVIVAAHGVAYGLAIDILCACDIRYSTPHTKFSIKEVDVGLAADIGTLARLPKITGNESLLRELALTARDFGVEEAARLGMISRVVQGGRKEVLGAIDAALETARIIASKSPIAVVGTKRILLHARDHSVEENLEYTATWNQVMLQSSDTLEAFKSFRTKQPPQFKPLPKLLLPLLEKMADYDDGPATEMVEAYVKEHSQHTIGVEFSSRTINIGEKRVKLQLWDTAGQERFRSVTRSYYRGAAAAILVYDITSRASFLNLPRWLADARALASSQLVTVLVGNKTDREEEREVEWSEASKWAAEN